jgi:hypothetical protein
MENLDKSDVKKAIKIYMDSDEFKAKVEKIVKEKLKDNKEIEDKTLAITKNVLSQLFKTLWMKRNTWQNNITNKNN